MGFAGEEGLADRVGKGTVEPSVDVSSPLAVGVWNNATEGNATEGWLQGERRLRYAASCCKLQP